MIPELGHFALILALIAATAQIYGPLARQAAKLQLFLVALAFLALLWCYLVTDLSVLNVATNSHSLKPFLYKIAGTWGNHEGSMLLWVLMLSLFGGLIARNPETSAIKQKTIQIQGCLSLGFIAYTLFASNPFTRTLLPPINGQGLNPVLQDPALAFHPPLLYMGYVGFSVAFAYAVAALWQGHIDKDWAKAVKPWVILAWTTLSAGIALGSYWAFYELGWGGWWFWDPVENASLMPWLTGSALLHSVLVMEKRGGLQRWTVLLAIITFSLSMLGTFLVRSGVLTSVHAFAVDPLRGSFILGLLFIYTGSALLLYGRRSSKLTTDITFAPLSREGTILLNNLFLTTIAATILTGTLYPLLMGALDAQPVFVGPPYFHMTVVPLAIPMVMIMAIGPLLPWKKSDWASIFPRLKATMVALILTALVVWGMKTPAPFFSVIGITLAIWLIGSTLTQWLQRLGNLSRLRSLPASQWALSIAHLGLGVAILGMTGSMLWSKEYSAVMQPGDTLKAGHYVVTLDDVAPRFGANYSAITATLSVRDKNSKDVYTTLTPEERHYPVGKKTTKETSIKTNLRHDIYAVMGGRDDKGWVIRITTHPLIACLWVGFMLIVAGGVISLIGCLRSRHLPATDKKAGASHEI